MRPRRLLAAVGALTLSACASTAVPAPPPLDMEPGWASAPAAIREVGLGLPGGAQLAEGVTFAGGIEIVADPASPLHSLSDLKLLGGGFAAVSDAGDLVRALFVLDGNGRLVGLEGLATTRLSLQNGRPIADKADGDAEGLFLSDAGDLFVSFERHHRIWNYRMPERPSAAPTTMRRPDFAFGSNDGMEAISAHGEGWRVAGESGGVWDCTPRRCVQVVAPPRTPIPDSEYRITGMDRDPSGDGFFVVQRLYRPPVDARAQVRRMAADGTPGPMLVELKLPGLTDNFEGLAARRYADGVRLYILSDDNGSDRQRTLLLAFDVSPTPAH